jgi:DNA-directed RNA polymerase subunit RPC12/RpoP
MDYLSKICPTCGSEFVVLKDMEEKATYCTLKCLLKFEEKPKENIGFRCKKSGSVAKNLF